MRKRAEDGFAICGAGESIGIVAMIRRAPGTGGGPALQELILANQRCEAGHQAKRDANHCHTVRLASRESAFVLRSWRVLAARKPDPVGFYRFRRDVFYKYVPKPQQ